MQPRPLLKETFANHEITFDQALPIWNEMSPQEKQQSRQDLVKKYNTEFRRTAKPDDKQQLRQQLNDALTSQPKSGLPSFLRKGAATAPISPKSVLPPFLRAKSAAVQHR